MGRCSGSIMYFREATAVNPEQETDIYRERKRKRERERKEEEEDRSKHLDTDTMPAGADKNSLHEQTLNN